MAKKWRIRQKSPWKLESGPQWAAAQKEDITQSSWECIYVILWVKFSSLCV